MYALGKKYWTRDASSYHFPVPASPVMYATALPERRPARTQGNVMRFM